MKSQIIKKIFVLICCISIGVAGLNIGCNQQDFTQTVGVVLSDVSGAVGGAQLVIETAGPPATPAQAICAAVWGGIAGAEASSRTVDNWPGKFNDTVTLAKLHASCYDPNNPYEQIGIQHNELLNNYFKINPETNQRPQSLISNDLATNFMSDYLLNPGNTLRADCPEVNDLLVFPSNRVNMNNTAKKLIDEGIRHRAIDFSSPENFDAHLSAMALRECLKTPLMC